MLPFVFGSGAALSAGRRGTRSHPARARRAGPPAGAGRRGRSSSPPTELMEQAARASTASHTGEAPRRSSAESSRCAASSPGPRSWRGAGPRRVRRPSPPARCWAPARCARAGAIFKAGLQSAADPEVRGRARSAQAIERGTSARAPSRRSAKVGADRARATGSTRRPRRSSSPTS